mmetsp:Transcript_20744/g.31400  ORF Transcript_20744/g.31400 Transcript_20744/m.31400 type:complete len:434 (+) Transcript_20744:112-1413(+)
MKTSLCSSQLAFVLLLTQIGLLTVLRHSSVIFESCKTTTDTFDRPTFNNKSRNNMFIKKKFRNLTQEIFDSESDAHLDGVILRAFPRWPDNISIPCSQVESKKWWSPKVMRSPTKRGYLFVKEMKTGSSTVGGVVLRIARNVARRMGNKDMCNVRIDHTNARALNYADRIRNESFLFTMIRNPEKRVTSQFFHFLVSRKKQEPSDVNFQSFLNNSKYLFDYYLRDLALVPSKSSTIKNKIHFYEPQKITSESLKTLRLGLANNIMHGYDFIGITERMDESLVAMKMILRLKISDILYVKAKSSGSFDDGAFNHTCAYIVPSFVSPGMKAFFQSPFYLHQTQGDWMLYRAANKSLDLTIDQLGRPVFEKELKIFVQAQKLVKARCEKNIRWPCSSGGVRAPYRAHVSNATDCLWLDSGCGAECLDTLESEIDRF